MGSDNNTVKVRVKTITAICMVEAGLVNIVSVHLDLILQNKIPSKTSVVLCKYPFQNSLFEVQKWLPSPPEGKQNYLRVPRPDKDLCCSPKTNTPKVSCPQRYQSHSDL